MEPTVLKFGDKVKIATEAQGTLDAEFVQEEENGMYVCRISSDYHQSGHSMKGFLIMADASQVSAAKEEQPGTAVSAPAAALEVEQL